MSSTYHSSGKLLAEGAGIARHGDGVFRLADAMRERTRSLHARAERSGMVNEVLRGCADRNGYALLLRNLLPAYRELEAGLDRHRTAPGLRLVVQTAVYRASAIQSDLVALCGETWEATLSLLPASERYAGRISEVAEGDATRLIAHAYARYLGDLSGGQILRERLARSLGLGEHALSYCAFPDIADLSAFKGAYRDALDRAAIEISDIYGVIDEAEIAFRLNIDVSVAVKAALAGPPSVDAAGS